VPYGSTYIDPKTGATASGTVSVYGLDGWVTKEIQVGLHPNAIINSTDEQFVYVANGNSDMVSVISTGSLQIVDGISVKLMPGKKSFIGDTPNALAINNTGTTLYVANGLDNAVAVVKLGSKAAAKGFGKSEVQGFIPTEAYPGGLALHIPEVWRSTVIPFLLPTLKARDRGLAVKSLKRMMIHLMAMQILITHTIKRQQFLLFKYRIVKDCRIIPTG